MKRKTEVLPLADPLFKTRRVVSRLFLFTLCMFLLGVCGMFYYWSITGWSEKSDFYKWACRSVLIFVSSGTSMSAIVLFWSLLPRRPVNALYLRTFHNDHQTWPVRKAIRRGLGRKFRLGGIRDPIIRKSIWHWFGLIYFVCRYGTPKYMNLEAGSDWKERLWRSLHHTRCVFIDVSEITQFVSEEIQIAYETVGSERILFFGSNETKENCRTRVAKVLGCDSVATKELNIAIWESTASRLFCSAVSEFRMELSNESVPDNGNSFEFATSDKGVDAPRDAIVHSVWRMAVSSLLLGLAYLFVGIGIALALSDWPAFIFLVAPNFTIPLFILMYLYHATWYQRLRFLGYAAIASAWFVYVQHMGVVWGSWLPHHL